MRERKTIDRNAMRAKHFLGRATEASDPEARLVCLYNSYVCLNGPFSACEKASCAAKMEASEFRALIDSCIGDADADRPKAESGYDINAIANALQSELEALLSSADNN